MKVKPKLYLNMSPQTVEDGALAFARNMKIDDDGNLVSDFGYQDITIDVDGDETPLNSYNIVGHIVGIDNTIYFFAHYKPAEGAQGVETSYIIEYNELTNEGHIINSDWHYSGGKITGCVNTNITGEKILTIGEYDAPVDVPLKHINLSHAGDDETFYSQAPEAPTANLILKDTYVTSIPNGTYVFFIRYRIRKDVYTNWFLCSHPVFAGTSESTATLQGGLKYINIHRDSAKSFVFQLTFPYVGNKSSYDEFQLGFIITHDEATDARIWKSFKLSGFANSPASYDAQTGNKNLIYFDYDNVKETDIDDLLRTTYEVYNVNNIAAFKNKLYISNYKESDLNVNIQNIASNVILSPAAQAITNIIQKDVTFSIDGTDYSAIYNYTKRYYDSVDDSGTITSIADLMETYWENIRGIINLNLISNLIKDETTTIKDVLTFKVNYNADIYPNYPAITDIAFVNTITNNLLGKAIFGPDFLTGYPGSEDTPWRYVYAKYGIIQLDSIGDDNRLSRYIRSGDAAAEGDPEYPNHPWYDLGLTFAFGSLADIDNYPGKYNEFFKFNKDTLTYDNLGEVENYWYARDQVFTAYAKGFIPEVLKKEIESKKVFILDYIEILSGAKTETYHYFFDVDDVENHDKDNEYYVGVSEDGYQLYMSDCLEDYVSTNNITSSLKDKIIDSLVDLCRHIQGFDDNGTPVFKVDGDVEIKSNTLKFVFTKCDFNFEYDERTNIDSQYNLDCRVNMDKTKYYVIADLTFKDTALIININTNQVEQSSTLMPFSVYQPYIHLVDKHNIINNGIPLSQIRTDTTGTNGLNRIFLQYRVINAATLNNYETFFISLVNIGDIIIEGFGWTKVGDTNILHCIELDSMLYNVNDNITIIDETGTEVTPIAEYYSSGNANSSLAFGNCGFVTWIDSSSYATNTLYIKVKRTKAGEQHNDLIKASGYIPIANVAEYTELPDGFYGSYICNVVKADFDLSSSCYVSGNDVYSAERESVIRLFDFKSYIATFGSITYTIRSNFNLNYLSLTEDVNDKVFSVGSAASGIKQVAKIINSAILSYIYELKSMYKDFSNKLFRERQDENVVQFDNTIRVSNVLSDETFNNSVFKFDSENYYNIPTDRGIIVNLFSIGNTIFAHCKHSLFKFDGNQTIMASENDIRLQETEPFDIGVSQVFDSQYGYGGIDNKEAGCITFDSYVFYDRFSNHIFAYGGNSQIQQIDGSIYKLLSYYKPYECYTIHDDANHRILFDFVSESARFAISYNYKAKAFISLHDITLEKAFSSRLKCYSYLHNSTPALCSLFDADEISSTVLEQASHTLALYGCASSVCGIQFGTSDYKVQDTPFGIAVVMYPIENVREVINTVKYISNIIKEQISEETTESETPIKLYDLISNPEQMSFDTNNRNRALNPVVSMYIITDSCLSYKIGSNVDETSRPTTLLDNPEIPNGLLDYKGFRYDIDSWNTNYIRNRLHDDNVYQYPDQPRPNEHPNADNNSLVFGKYFILNFNFRQDKPIKFEHIFITTNIY